MVILTDGMTTRIEIEVRTDNGMDIGADIVANVLTDTNCEYDISFIDNDFVVYSDTTTLLQVVKLIDNVTRCDKSLYTDIVIC